MGEIDSIIDGVFCQKCGTLHPKLHWHEKFNDYLLDKEQIWLEAKKKRPNLFKDAVYKESLSVLVLEEMQSAQACRICGHETNFCHRIKKIPVCSNDCLAKLKIPDRVEYK